MNDDIANHATNEPALFRILRAPADAAFAARIVTPLRFMYCPDANQLSAPTTSSVPVAAARSDATAIVLIAVHSPAALAAPFFAHLLCVSLSAAPSSPPRYSSEPDLRTREDQPKMNYH